MNFTNKLINKWDGAWKWVMRAGILMIFASLITSVAFGPLSIGALAVDLAFIVIGVKLLEVGAGASQPSR
jgi:hypothetical protein